MKKNQIENAFAQIKNCAGKDEKLQRNILQQIEIDTQSKVPFNGLKRLTMYFLVYLLAGFFVNTIVVSLLPSPGIYELPELVQQSRVEQITDGLRLLSNSERLINLLIEGCFNLFFKISFLAFIFAAALMKVETSKASCKGEKLCVD